MVTMPLHWKKQLANAHHEHRKTLNKVHTLESSFDTRVADERRRREVAEADAARLAEHAMNSGREAQELRKLAEERRRYKPLSDAELVALAAVIMTEALPATPARARIIDDLTYRGVLPPKEP
jgi:hypothetical protein